MEENQETETSKIEQKQNEESKLEILKSKIRENPWKVTSAFLGLACLILLILVLRPGITANVVSGTDAGDKLIDYLNSRVGGGVEYLSYTDLGNLYQISVKYKGETLPVYVTKDGKYFVQSISPITGQVIQTQTPEQPQPQDIPKSDVPKVELFVMTHCPYGTQAEKGIIPVFKELGNEIDGKIRFVHYFMHGDKEEKETYRQVCIREEQSSKFLDYLSCFLEDGDSERCLSETGINTVTLDTCIKQRAEDYYEQDSKLSQSYDVRGSPTLIINGVQASSSRSPAAFLSTICSAFNEEAEKCSSNLPSTTPSPGFGYGAGGAGTASCG